MLRKVIYSHFLYILVRINNHCLHLVQFVMQENIYTVNLVYIRSRGFDPYRKYTDRVCDGVIHGQASRFHQT